MAGDSWAWIHSISETCPFGLFFSPSTMRNQVSFAPLRCHTTEYPFYRLQNGPRSTWSDNFFVLICLGRFLDWVESAWVFRGALRGRLHHKLERGTPAPRDERGASLQRTKFSLYMEEVFESWPRFVEGTCFRKAGIRMEVCLFHNTCCDIRVPGAWSLV